MVVAIRLLESGLDLYGSAPSSRTQYAYRCGRARATPVGVVRRVLARLGVSPALAWFAAGARRFLRGLAFSSTVAPAPHERRRHQGDCCPGPADGRGSLVLGANRGKSPGGTPRADLPDARQVARTITSCQTNPLRRLSCRGRAQRGAYALEFSLVFLVFFLVFYGLLTYGLVFAAQQSLTLAAQDAARSVLRWQPGTSPLVARANAARDTAVLQADWMASMSSAPINVAVCANTGSLSSTAGGACSGETLSSDQIEVLVSYAYGAHPLIPNLPILGAVLMPASSVLSARATVHLGNVLDAGVN